MSRFILLLNVFFWWSVSGVAQTITTFQYWFDGNYATHVNTYTGSTYQLDMETMVSVQNLSYGLHDITMRFQDSQGKWSATVRDFLFIADTQMAGYEYWFDNAYDQRTYVASSGEEAILLQDLDVSYLPDGLHQFHFRAKDSKGLWSAVTSSFFMLSVDKKITEVEYWFDQDYDEKTNVTYSGESTLNFLQMLAIQDFEDGLHTLHFRAKDNKGKWSVATSAYFMPKSHLVGYEYWYDDRQDEAVFVSVDPTFLLEINESFPTQNLPNGTHTLHFRAKNNYDEWSSVITSEFIKGLTESITQAPTLLLPTYEIAEGSSVTFTGSHYTPNGNVKLKFFGAGGVYSETLTAAANGSISFDYTPPAGSDAGAAAVRAFDLASSQTSVLKNFEITEVAQSPYLALLTPILNQKVDMGTQVRIGWHDKMIAATNDFVYPVLVNTANRLYDYQIEYRKNPSEDWALVPGFSDFSGVALLQSERDFSFLTTFTEPSTQYQVRITDNLNTSIVATSDFFEVGDIRSCTLHWDHSRLDNPAVAPIGVVADGTARIYIKVSPKSGIVQSAQITLQNATGDTSANLLGKVQAATVINALSTEANGANSITATSTNEQENAIWFWYVAPDDFNDGKPEWYSINTRPIEAVCQIIKTDGSTENVTIPILVKRPKLMFVHGLGSDASSFSKFKINGTETFQSKGFETYYADILHNGSFENNAKALLGQRNGATPTFQDLLAQDRSQGFASCKVDYVGHSMAGNVARKAEYTQGYHDIRMNYNKGYINKLFTINSPHLGSPLADLLADFIEDMQLATNIMNQARILGASGTLFEFGRDYIIDPESKWYYSFMRPRVTDDPVLESNVNQFLAMLGLEQETYPNFEIIATDAVKDLRIDDGVHLQKTHIKSHVIVGDWIEGVVDNPELSPIEDIDFDSMNLEQFEMLSDLRERLGWVFDIIEYCEMTELFDDEDDDFYSVVDSDNDEIEDISIIDQWNHFVTGYQIGSFIQDSDLVVDLKSQTAGIPIEPNNNLSYFYDVDHLNVNEQGSVANRVYELLNKSIQSQNFGEIPGVENGNGGGSWRSQADEETSLFDNLDLNLLNVEVNPNKMQLIDLANPNVHVDEIVTFQVQLFDLTGFKSVELKVGNELYYGGQPYNGIVTFHVQITNDILGPLTVVAKARYLNDGVTTLVYDTTGINIAESTEDVLTGISINPNVIEMWVGDVYHPIVTANYTTFNTNLQLTPTLLADNIVSYNVAENRIVAEQPGETQVTFTYNGQTTILYIIVRATQNVDCHLENEISLNQTITEGAVVLNIVNATDVNEIVWLQNGNVIANNTAVEQTVLQDGAYRAAIYLNNGCNYTTNEVTVLIPIYNSTSIAACESYVWALNNVVYTQSGIYNFQTTDADGRIHNETLQLTINQPTSNAVTESACGSYTWVTNNQVYDQSGTYEYVTTNAQGCTHTETLNLTVIAIETPVVELSGNEIVSNASEGNQWYNENGAIAGATLATFTPTVNGNYYVVVTQNDCSSAPSNVINYSTAGVEESLQEHIKVFPNPTNDILNIEVLDNLTIGNIKIYNVLGQKMENFGVAEDFTKIDISKLPAATYFVEINTDKGTQTFKVFKN